MRSTADVFEELYAKWKSFIANDANPLSSSDADYIRNPQFEAIVQLGEGAIPLILEKLRTNDSAHFLVHALGRIAGDPFTPGEIADAQRRYGAPLGNQGYARLWQEWWGRRSEQ